MLLPGWSAAGSAHAGVSREPNGTQSVPQDERLPATEVLAGDLHVRWPAPLLAVREPGRLVADLRGGVVTDVDAGWNADEMDGSAMMNRLAEVIDAHAWDELTDLLREDFVCSYVHTGERFDRATWVRLNADYPGFDRFVLQDCIGSTARAAGRSHVTGHVGGTLQHFEVATFITLRAGRISEMTEVWTDVNEQAPHGQRSA